MATTKRARYAEGTQVAPEKSQFEIRILLSKYGCQGFAFAETADLARIEFMAHKRRVRFTLPMPPLMSERFYKPRANGRDRTEYKTLFGRAAYWRVDAAAQAEWSSEVRRLWRCLLIAIKAKLEVVESGMAIFEEEFLANIVLPDGRTAGEHVVPAIARAYESGKVAGLLGPGSDL